MNPDPKTIWNGWTTNYSRANDGYITHAFLDDKTGRSLCGVRISEGGGWNLFDDGWTPGCRKCRRSLRKMGFVIE